ncbi:MAG: HAMP domain-containing protein, partial [Acidimicrobiia bacterium]|nr:HAMP domain-containing protein [Acidimicrobiia bacterium]
MSLRWRLTAVIGGVVALMVAGASVLAYVSADRELNRQIDEFLLSRSREAELALDSLDFPRIGPSLDTADAIRVGALTRPDAGVQVLYRNGNQVLVLSEPNLPINREDIAIARNEQPGDTTVRRLDEREVDGVRYRVLTSSVDNGALMIGRSVEEVDQTLVGLRGWLVAISVSGTVAAALVGWLVANRVLRPVRRLAAATRQVAETRRFDADLRVEGSDELGALATSFNTMLSTLRASREQQHRLVRDANHELRTPLTSLRTNVDVLRRRRERLDAAERSAIVESMDAEVRELSLLVNELVESATDASVLADSDAFMPVDLAEMAERVAERTTRRTGRSVTLDVRNGLVLGDPTGLERALGNLVGNAVKFSGATEPIEIVVDGPRVEVRDRGPGIPRGDHERVFDRFYRSDRTRTLPGSGLGLAIVAEVAAAHG